MPGSISNRFKRAPDYDRITADDVFIIWSQFPDGFSRPSFSFREASIRLPFYDDVVNNLNWKKNWMNDSIRKINQVKTNVLKGARMTYGL